MSKLTVISASKDHDRVMVVIHREGPRGKTSETKHLKHIGSGVYTSSLGFFVCELKPGFIIERGSKEL